MHKAFFPLFLTSFLGIALSSVFQHSSGALQWMGLVAGLLPLMIYHWTLMRTRLLSSTEIDSVYYFGFLVTVITLVTTAISIGLTETKPELKWVLLQFGLGLVATGYALFARLHLLAKSTTSAEVDVVDSTEKLAKNVERVAKEFDNAGFQVQAFVERTEQRLLKFEQDTATRLDAVVANFQEQLAAAQVVFQDGLNKSVESTLEKSAKTIAGATQKFSEEISCVMEEIIRMQSEAKGISFALASQRISEFSNEMESSIRSITTSVHESASASSAAVAELAATFNKTAKLAAEISKKLQALDGVVALVSSIQDATEAIANFSQSTSDAEAALSSLSVKTSLAEEIIRDQVAKPIEKSRLGQALSEFEAGFTAASVTFNSKLQSLSDLFPGMESGASSLSEKMTSVSKAVSKMGDAMNASPVELNAAIGHLNTQISAVSNAIEIALPELNTAVASVAEKLKAFDLDRLVNELPKKPALSESA